MPYQQALVPTHASATQATVGAQLVFSGLSAYDIEVAVAKAAGLVQGSKYTVARLFTSVGDPMVALTGLTGSYDLQMFTLFVALYGYKTSTITAGSGGTNGTFALPIGAPGAGGVQATGTFTVSGGAVTAVNITNQGSGYPNSNLVLNNAALVALSAGLTGASITLNVGQVN